MSGWRKYRKADSKLTEAVMPYVMIALCIFMGGQAINDWFVEPWYPDGFFPTQTIEGQIEEVGVTSRKQGSKKFTLSNDDREFVLPRGLEKSKTYKPEIGDLVRIQTAAAARQGNWLNPDKYWQVMALAVDGHQVYGVVDYENYKGPADWESRVIVALAAIVIVGLSYFIFWRSSPKRRR